MITKQDIRKKLYKDLYKDYCVDKNNIDLNCFDGLLMELKNIILNLLNSNIKTNSVYILSKINYTLSFEFENLDDYYLISKNKIIFNIETFNIEKIYNLGICRYLYEFIKKDYIDSFFISKNKQYESFIHEFNIDYDNEYNTDYNNDYDYNSYKEDLNKICSTDINNYIKYIKNTELYKMDIKTNKIHFKKIDGEYRVINKKKEIKSILLNLCMDYYLGYCHNKINNKWDII